MLKNGFNYFYWLKYLTSKVDLPGLDLILMEAILFDRIAEISFYILIFFKNKLFYKYLLIISY